MVFVVLVIALAGIAWYLNNSLSGQSISTDTLESFKLEKTNLEMQNSILYLEQSLWDSAANASQTVANLAGRNISNETNGSLLYWRCDLHEVHNSGREVFYQIPSIDRVRLSLQNKTMKYMENRLNELHGIRDNVIYEVGKVLCGEVGYNKPLNVPTNTRFRTAANIDKLNVTFESYKRSRSNFTFNDEVRYNRFWYMYSKMAKWTKEQNMEQDIKNEMSKVYDWVDDVYCMPTCQCPCPYQLGCMKIPVNWSALLRQAVDKGIGKSVSELEKGSRYFNNNEVSCGYGIELSYYDNVPFLTQTPIGCCGPDCESCLMYCRLDYQYDFEGDIDIRCTDQRFKSIPRKDLEKLTWRIRFNVEATDPPNEGQYPNPCSHLSNPSCKEEDSPNKIGTLKFPNCRIKEDNFTLCKTGVNVIGNLTKKEIEAGKK